jgi:endonuclease-3
MLVQLHGGQYPRTCEELEALPGVGRKTANVVLNVAFGQPTMAVDTHIFRVSNRTGWHRQESAGSRKAAAQARTRRIRGGLPSLADPAGPLCLPGAQARCWNAWLQKYCDFTPKTPAPAAGKRAENASNEYPQSACSHIFKFLSSCR